MGTNRKLDHSGFSIAEALLVIVVVAVIGVVGWVAWHTKQRTYPTSKPTKTSTSTQPTVNSNVGSNGEAIVNSCPGAPNTSWCSFFYSYFQLGIKYPAGWRSTAEPGDLGTDLGTAVYGIDFSPLNDEGSYIRINVYKGTLTQTANKVHSGFEAKDIKATSTTTKVQGNSAIRFDYTSSANFGNSVPVSEYLIATHGFVFDYDSRPHVNTPALSQQAAQTMFNSLNLYQ